ncbi:MAG: tRNA (adenosine(37)-N6)-threonylcarbamoyltransferase complex ATPase subunit type 1 TsaE [Isosphaeraceae bacterium]
MEIARSPDGLTLVLNSEEDTTRLGRALAELVEPGVVIGLVGPLGAGKTRLVRAIAEALDVDPEAISSPTFVLIQEYDGRLPVYHLDTYRLPGPSAFEDLGVADYWDTGVSLVEWADRVRNLLPTDCWMIALDPSGPTTRTARIELPPSARSVLDRLFDRLA